jgi:ferrous iron transport protein A
MTRGETGVVLIVGGQADSQLVSILERLGGYRCIESVCLNDEQAALHQAIERVLAAGVRRVLITPAMTVGDSQAVRRWVSEELKRCQETHPEVQFFHICPSMEPELHARLLQTALQAAEGGGMSPDAVPLSLLPTHQDGTVHKLNGGHEFVSRMSALGFVPGSEVQVVQNFGVGPMIVAVQGTRIALGREEARKVRVLRHRRAGRFGRAHRKGRFGWRRHRG